MAATYRPSLAKNMIRRSLRGIIDPYPTDTEIDRLWHHFESQCIYCGRKVGVRPKDAHLDHLDAGVGGGVNHISNRVLSCDDCNEKEKREIPWREFLGRKSQSQEEYDRRISLIDEWMRLTTPQGDPFSERIYRQVEEEIKAVINRFEGALRRIRELRDSDIP